MATSQPAEPLAPDVAARLVDFARACRAATRIVSLYPPSHPAIQSALTRIVEAGATITDRGPFTVSVLPDTLLVDGRRMQKTDVAVAEFATLLHDHLVGELTLLSPLAAEGWHAFLSLLARPPEDVRAEGRITQAWQAAGGGPIAIREIDYAELLREGTDDQEAQWDTIIATCLRGQRAGGGGALDDDTLAVLREIADDARQLAAFAARLQGRYRKDGVDLPTQKRAIVELMHALAEYTARLSPDELDSVLTHIADAATTLSPDVMLALMTDPPPVGRRSAGGAPLDLALELPSRLTDAMLARFVAENVVKNRGATGRLAEAFQTLVGDDQRQQDVLALAEAAAAASPLGQETQFPGLWSGARELLLSYSDTKFVSPEYAAELTAARAQAIEVERVSDDSPERIAAWLHTVNDEAMRVLDQQLLLDLLRIEERPDAWATVLEQALVRIEQLVLVGDLGLANALVDAVVAAAKVPTTAVEAQTGLQRLSTGPLVRHIVLFVRQAPDGEVALATRLCLSLGPPLLPRIADALVVEDNARTVRRLRDVLLAFGPAVRPYAHELRLSTTVAVRRVAVELLKEIAGTDALPDLRSLLDDADGVVQREALRAIVQIGTSEAYGALELALRSRAPRTRDAITQVLVTLRDERAAPLLAYILQETTRGPRESIHLSAIEALGNIGRDRASIAALREVLHRGSWWTPLRNARVRAATAAALRNIGTPEATTVLNDALAGGSRGVRAAARTALTAVSRPDVPPEAVT